MSDIEDFIEELENNGDVKELNKIKEIKEKWEYNRLKNKVIERLETMLDDVKYEKFKDIYKTIKYSPAGDGWGCENYIFESCGGTWKANEFNSEGDLATDILKLIDYKRPELLGGEK